MFAPGARVAERLVHSSVYLLVIGIIYSASLIAGSVFGVAAEGAGFTSIDAIARLFDHPNGIILGWTHHLVFDLFVGAWIGRDARRHQMPHTAVIPCLLATYVFGPVGLMVYLPLRAIIARSGMGLEERAASGAVGVARLHCGPRTDRPGGIRPSRTGATARPCRLRTQALRPPTKPLTNP